jgi:hypothetical protein
MGPGVIVINIVFAAFVLVAIPAPLIWAIFPAHRDHRAVAPAIETPAFEPELVAEEQAVVAPGLA